jgi:hypothetical protein
VARNAKSDDADEYFGILRDGCETRIPRMMEIALDALHYLIGTYLIYFIFQFLIITHMDRTWLLEREGRYSECK